MRRACSRTSRGQGRRLGRRIRRELGEQLRLARSAAGLSQSVLGRTVDTSHTKVGRIESGDYPAISLGDLCALFAVVGYDLSVRAYPVASPLRDRAQFVLLERLHGVAHSTLGLADRVPFPNPGDLRAWDAVIAI